LTLEPRELALEELAATPDGAERIAVDDKQRRIGRRDTAASGPYFIKERLVYA